MMRTPQRGITLIEVLVTLLVFTVGLLGVAALQLNALKGIADSNQRSQATWVMQELAERMRANSVGGESGYTTAPNCSTLPTNWCADHYNPVSGAKVNATTCTSDQMAAFDRWEAQCSYAASATYAANATAAAGRYTSTDFLTAPAQGSSMTVSANNHLLTVTSRWTSKGDEAKQQSSESVLSATLGVRR
ncbi:type IV pilus modification protein PilV [Pseudomonas sp. NY15435]|uniref:type IV pilus modification protein PilV n=1 Tax=Pseudomonas sp. NY15435 TaxID=3400358 RepID=UPI003A85BEF4